MADEMEREKARQRVTDAMVRKAKAGQVTGGRCFGYDNVRIDASSVVRRVNAAEAAVVRQIFTLSAQGSGLKQIAHRLNEAGALAPCAQQARPAGWAPSSVREILYRELYRGRIVWNRTRKRDAWGRKAQTARPEAEWITTDMPAIRIVSEEQWRATHVRLGARRALYAPEAVGDAGGFAGRKTGGGIKYLLSRLARCGVCGSGFAMRSRSHGATRNYRYGCVCNWNRGRRACANNREVPLTTADATVIGALEADLLRPAVIDAAIERVIAACETADDVTERRRALDREIARLDRELENLVAAVAVGGDAPRLMAGMRDRETRKVEAEAERDGLAHAPASVLNATEIRRRLRAKVADCRALLAGDVAGARRLLELLLDGFIVFTPAKNRSGFDAYQVRIPLRLDRVFDAVICQDVWRPRADPRCIGDGWSSWCFARRNVQLGLVLASPTGEADVWQTPVKAPVLRVA
jgi:hypothetical protein